MLTLSDLQRFKTDISTQLAEIRHAAHCLRAGVQTQEFSPEEITEFCETILTAVDKIER
jgi:hypothetical protein